MRRSLLLLTVVLLPAGLAAQAASQGSGSTGGDTPDALNVQYKQAMEAHNWASALTAAQKLVDQNAGAANLLLLADAQLFSNAAADALATYDRALAAAEKEKPAAGQPDAGWKDVLAKIYLGKGNALLKSRRNDEAVDAYQQSAALASNPSVPLFNICATYSNAGDTQNAEPACRKAVQADPARANAWFVLATLLFGEAKMDAKGNFAITGECRQALEKYLELAPDGPHAADVKAMLAMAPQ